MNPSNLDHFVLLSRLPDVEKGAFATRCARLALKILNSVSFPIAATDRRELESVVRLAEGAMTSSTDAAELFPALRALGHLAFTSPRPSPYGLRSEVILSQVAHAVYAAGLTVLTGSAAHAQDALEYTLEASNAAGVTEVEATARDWLFSLRKSAVPPYSTDLPSKAARNEVVA